MVHNLKAKKNFTGFRIFSVYNFQITVEIAFRDFQRFGFLNLLINLVKQLFGILILRCFEHRHFKFRSFNTYLLYINFFHMLLKILIDYILELVLMISFDAITAD